uniref:Sperm-activating peptide (SAP-I) n=2 Tax=Echinidea TaxID=7675 RepID=Q7M4B5_MESNU|nr:sperm-activating peptide (Br-Phe-2 SAP-I) - sea urchin (Tripneustes gratilla) [Tripneustes gratilla]prf//0705150A sperm-activating peptide [Hemicentrotus pulcherrimus]prf//1502213A sperm-activating peptide [Strongylocentrotus purpuratus]prf//1616199B sperm-activating peptide I [Tripneustes gratilla]prf//1616199H sperm-activating peptide I (2-Phe(Br)) [Tripneustes gratilla]
GFDLNGGGVG